jgi:hypothetical protein
MEKLELETLAGMLGWAPEDVSAAFDELENGFMRPDVEFIAGPVEGCDIPETSGAWYGRLSAPGYLDCTEWSGPFDSDLEAWAYLLSTYAD